MQEDLKAAPLHALLGRRDAPALAELQRRFEAVAERTEKQKIASVLVRRFEDDRRYFEFLAGLAREAVESDMPFPYGFDVEGKIQPRQYAPAFLHWANLRGVSPDQSAGYAVNVAPTDVFLLALADDPRSRDILLKGVGSPNLMVASRAAWGLARLRDRSAVPRIIEAAEAAPADARELIARALVLFDTLEAQAAADRLIRDEKVREALRMGAKQELEMNIGEAVGSLRRD